MQQTLTSGEMVGRRAQAWIKQRAANIGGLHYLVGNVSQLLDGAYSGDGYKIGSGISLLAASAGFTWLGRNNTAFAVSSTLGGIGVYLATHQAVFQQGDMASTAGLALTTLSATLGALSAPLTEQFKNAKSAILRRTLGMPRRIMSAVSIAGKLPLLAHAVTNQQWKWAAVLTLWTIGDGFMALSNAQAARTSPAPAP